MRKATNLVVSGLSETLEAILAVLTYLLCGVC